jgi:transposase-like protein
VVIGLRVDGRKEILGFWISQKESSSFWVGVLNDLKSRGVRDVLMNLRGREYRDHLFSVDGLSGFEEAIRSVYPRADIQQCVIHQIRNTLR